MQFHSQDIEDRNLLVGHICKLIGCFDQAQEHFLASSDPVMALEVHVIFFDYYVHVSLFNDNA